MIKTYQTNYESLKGQLYNSMAAVDPKMGEELLTPQAAAATAPQLTPITAIPAVMNFQDGLNTVVTGSRDDEVNGLYTIAAQDCQINSTTTTITGTLSLGMPGILNIENVTVAIKALQANPFAAAMAEVDADFGLSSDAL